MDLFFRNPYYLWLNWVFIFKYPWIFQMSTLQLLCSEQLALQWGEKLEGRELGRLASQLGLLGNNSPL